MAGLVSIGLQSTGAVDDQSMPLAHRVRHWLEEWFGQEPLWSSMGMMPSLKASGSRHFCERSGIVMVLPQPFKWLGEVRHMPSGRRPVAGARQQPVCIGGERFAEREQIDGSMAHGADDVQQLRPEQLEPQRCVAPGLPGVCAPKCGIRGRSIRSGVLVDAGGGLSMASRRCTSGLGGARWRFRSRRSFLEGS